MSRTTRRVLDPAKDPWERQSWETSRGFAAFQMYRDQSPFERSQRRVAREIGRALSIVERWAQGNQWVVRVQAWDDEQDRLARAAAVSERKAFAKRLAAQGALMQVRGLTRIRQFVDRVDRDGHPVELMPGQSYLDEMSVLDATRLVEIGSKMEAMGRGVHEDLEGQPSAGQTVIENPILAALVEDPQQTGAASEAMRQLLLAMGMKPPQLTNDGD